MILKMETYTFTKDTIKPKVQFTNIATVKIDPTTWNKGAQSDALDVLLDAVAKTATIETSPSVLRIAIDDVGGIGYSKETTGANSGEYYFEYRLYQRNNLEDSAWQSANNWTRKYIGANPPTTVNIEIPLEGDDGMYWVDVRVSDRINNTQTVMNSAFTLDRAKPVLTISNKPEAPTNVFKDQTGITLTGGVVEGNLWKMGIKVDNNPETAYPYVSSTDTSFWKTKTGTDTYTWSWNMPTAMFNTITTDGPHTITLTVYDYAGKTAYDTCTIIRDTTGPVITLNNINLAATASADNLSSIQETAAEIRVSFNDEYSNIGYTAPAGAPALGRYSFSYRIGNATYTNPTMQTYYFPATPEVGKSINASILIGSTSTTNIWPPVSTTPAGTPSLKYLPDGLYWVEIQVTDRANNTRLLTGPTPESAMLEKVWFRVNRSSPKLLKAGDDVNAEYTDKEGRIDNSNEKDFYSTFASGNVFNLSGQIVDGDFDRLEIKITNGMPGSTAGNTTVTYNVNGSNGTVTGTGGWNTNSGFSCNTATGVYNWTWNFTSGLYNDLTDGTNHTITVTAYDSQGVSGLGVMSTKTYTFAKDTQPPRLKISNILWGDEDTQVVDGRYEVTKQEWAGAGTDVSQQKALRAYASSFTTKKAVIMGSFEDAVSPIGGTAEHTLLPLPNVPDGTGVPKTDQYYFEYRIYTAAELANSKYTLPRENSTYPQWIKHPIGESPSKTVQWNINLYNFWLSNQKDGTGPNFYASDIPQGQYWMDIRVKDRSDFVFAVYNIVFTVATEPAELVLTTATQALNGQVFKAPFTVEGYGSDPVDINRVTIKVDGAPEVKHMPKAAAPNAGSYSSDGQSYTFSWNNSTAYSGTDENGDGTADATLPYFGTKFTTTGNAAGPAAPAAQQFTYNAHGLTSGEIVYVGGEPRYVYRVDDNNFKLFRTYSGGTNFTNPDPASGTAGNITVSTGLEEGPHVITITARSSSGISGANSTKQIAFTKDTEPPIVNFGNIDETKTLTKDQWQAASSTFSLSALNGLLATLKPKQIGSDAAIQGSFYDVNNELETTFQYRIYNSTTLRNTWTETAYASPSAPGTPQWTPVTLPAGKKSANWTIPLNTASIYWPATGGGDAPSSIPDGTWWLDIRVLDKTGNEAYFKNIVFTVDKSDPTITITPTVEPSVSNNVTPANTNVQPASPFVYGNYTGALFTLKGTANDVNLRKVEVKLSRNTDRYMATTDTAPDAPETDGSTTKSWQRIFSAASFTELATGASVGYTALDNGQYTITATAYDDSRTASATHTFIKDTAVPEVKFLTNAVNFDNNAISIQGSAIDKDSWGGVKDWEPR